MYNLNDASPSDLAAVLSSIKKIGKDKGWIRDTQIKHIDLMLGQLFKAQAKMLQKETTNANP